MVSTTLESTGALVEDIFKELFRAGVTLNAVLDICEDVCIIESKMVLVR